MRPASMTRTKRFHPGCAGPGERDVPKMLHGHGLYLEAHDAFRRTVRAVVDKEVLPFVAGWEEREEFPRELLTRFGEPWTTCWRRCSST
jgi:hypothetical protein